MTVIHLKKKVIVKSKVRGIEIEFDHEKLATILGVPRANGICEYIKEVWEESKYTKPLEITRRFANDENIMATKKGQVRRTKAFSTIYSFFGDEEYGSQAFGVPLVIKKGEEPKKYDFFEDTFLTMCKLTRENGIWWIGSGENRRRDEDVNAPEEDAEEEEETNKDDFDWEAVIDEATVEGESGEATPGSTRQKDKGIAGVDPSGPIGREAEFLKFQAEFERKRANRFHDDLEKAKAENARLLALLHQAQSKPHP
ncbi:hypothetical protein Dimus_022833 [Dionaea muscipula]